MSGAPPIRVWPDRAALAEGLAGIVAEALSAAAARDGRATLIAPGGTTPGPFLAALAARDLDWAAITVLPGDERWTPPDGPRSNLRLLRAAFAATDAVVRPLGPADAAAAAGPPRPADVADALPAAVAVLGMGEDLHTASLFPGADRLAEALAPDAPDALALTAPGAAEPRASLSLRVLREAGARHLLLTGAGKRAALDRALAPGPLAEAPVRGILACPGATVHWAA